MRLFIPTIGTKLELERDWTFRLYGESRNDSLVKSFNLYHQLGAKPTNWGIDYPWPHNKFVPFMLDAGTVLQVDRIFIRQKMADWDSVSFYVDSSPDPRLLPKKKQGFMSGRARFWAKLDDVNNIECKVV